VLLKNLSYSLPGVSNSRLQNLEINALKVGGELLSCWSQLTFIRPHHADG
jgi:hypothetical protein